MLSEPRTAAACPECRDPEALVLGVGSRASYDARGVHVRKHTSELRGCLRCGCRYVVTNRGVWRAPVFRMDGASPSPEGRAGARPERESKSVPFPVPPSDMDFRGPKA